jgi:selenoprotein W-related protein
LSKHNIEITYCTQCRWLLRAAWLAQELLTTFEQDLAGVSLRPGSNGIFDISLNQKLIFSRKEAGRFPEAKEIKQLVRDRIDPDRDLGHSDKYKQADT